MCAYNFKAYWNKFRKLLREDKITFYFKNIDKPSLETQQNAFKSSGFHKPSTRHRCGRSQLIFLWNGNNHSAETHSLRYWRHVSNPGIQNESLARMNACFPIPWVLRASVNLLFGSYGEKLSLRRNGLSLHMRAAPGLFIYSFPGMISSEFAAHGCRLQWERAVRRNW